MKSYSMATDGDTKNQRARCTSDSESAWVQYESLSEAARVLGVSKGGIYTHMKGHQSHVGGYHIRRVVVPTPWDDDWGPLL